MNRRKEFCENVMIFKVCSACHGALVNITFIVTDCPAINEILRARH